MLDSYENRKGMALTFGVVAHHCSYVLFAEYDRLFTKEWAHSIDGTKGTVRSFLKGNILFSFSKNNFRRSRFKIVKKVIKTISTRSTQLYTKLMNYKVHS